MDNYMDRYIEEIKDNEGRIINEFNTILFWLRNMFCALYSVNLKGNYFEELICHKAVEDMNIDKNNIQELFDNIVNKSVAKENIPAMHAFMNANNIDERLGNKPVIIQEYLSSEGERLRAYFFSIERENGKNKRVYFAIRIISNEEDALRAHDNLIKIITAPFENVFTVDIETHTSMCYRIGQAMPNPYGNNFTSINYEDSMSWYIEDSVIQEDRHLFDKVRTVEGVMEVLSDKKTIDFNYRTVREGEVHYFKCQLGKSSKLKNEFVIAFRNIDDEKKQEIEQQEKLEEAYLEVKKANITLRDEMEIAGVLSKDYEDAMFIDFENDTSTTLKKKGRMIPKEERTYRCSYTDTWDYYIDKYVVDEDKD